VWTAGTDAVGRLAPPGSHPTVARVGRGVERARRGVAALVDPTSRLEAAIRRLQLAPASMPWSGYYDDEFPDFNTRDSWTPKHKSVDAVLRSRRPASVVDVAGNRGWYAQLAARLGASVVAFDIDEGSVSKLYDDVHAAGLDVQPLVMDLTRPTPGEGIGYDHLPGATSRIKGELVLALAICHHLCYGQRVPLASAIDAVAAYAEDSLLFEFIDPTDRYVQEWGVPTPHGYSHEAARTHLLTMFDTVTEYPSNLTSRSLLLAEGRR
jgi:hypothetical protein